MRLDFELTWNELDLPRSTVLTFHTLSMKAKLWVVLMERSARPIFSALTKRGNFSTVAAWMTP